ncbi:MAG: hypothetical protein ACFFD4_32860 [Candidatus Odinarchaeota archaeon]
MNKQLTEDLSAEKLFEKALYDIKPSLSSQEIIELVMFFSKAFKDTEINLEEEIKELLSRLK